MKFIPTLRHFLLHSALIATATTAQANTVHEWTGANDSDFSNALNWTAAGVPGADGGPFAVRINIGTSTNPAPANPLVYTAAQGTTIYQITTNRGLVLGNGSSANGIMTITGGTFDSRGRDPDAIANGGGSGTLNISGGHYTNVNGGSDLFQLGLNFGGTATLNINRGSFTTGTLRVGDAGSGTGSTVNGIVNLTSVVVEETVFEGVLEIGDFARRANLTSSTVNFNGGILRARQDNPSFMGTADVNTARVEEKGAKIDTNGFNITIGRALIEGTSEGGGLTKQGEGTLTLGGENTYTGATVIEAGTLVLTGATQDTESITFASEGDGVLGLDIATPVTASSAAVNLANSTILVLGTPAANSHTLLTAASITGTPVLAETVGDYTLQIVGNTELRLVSDNPTADPYLAWAGEGVLFGDDANGDGVSNGLAFLLGATGPNASALDLLPAPTETGGALALTFQMRNAAARGTAVLNLQHSSDLGIDDDWTTVPVPDADGETVVGLVTFNVTPGDPLNTVTATIASDAATGTGKLFARFKAEN